MDKPIRIVLDRAPDRSHDVVFAAVSDLPTLLSERGLHADRCIMVTDANVAAIHGTRVERLLVEGGFTPRTIVIEPGEQSKSLPTYGRILDEALAHTVDRRTPVLALGGGVVGDLAGFLAATLLRGVPFVQIPTSLVAQVDSAIGGKTGINHRTGKNLIGAFYQPRLVAVDVRFLDTLPEVEWLDGLSEVVKYGLIADAAFASFLLENWGAIMARDHDVVSTMVGRCAEIKAEIVSDDETEQGRRAILNFGHTFAHALEREAGYAGITHGRAVALGMRAALHLSHLLHPEVDFHDAESLLHKLPSVRVDTPIDRLVSAMASDKKRVGRRLRFVILEEIGRAVVVPEVDVGDVTASWRAGLENQPE